MGRSAAGQESRYGTDGPGTRPAPGGGCRSRRRLRVGLLRSHQPSPAAGPASRPPALGLVPPSCGRAAGVSLGCAGQRGGRSSHRLCAGGPSHPDAAHACLANDCPEPVARPGGPRPPAPRSRAQTCIELRPERVSFHSARHPDGDNLCPWRASVPRVHECDVGPSPDHLEHGPALRCL